MRLFHISEESDIEVFNPRLPGRTDMDQSVGVVWAINERCLPNFLTPRDCPRVTYHIGKHTTEHDREKYLPSKDCRHVVVIERDWIERMKHTKLYLYEFASESFELQDEIAGYYVSRSPQIPIAKYEIEDLLEALATQQVVVQVVDNLWEICEAIKQTSFNWSMCRMGFAQKKREKDATEGFAPQWLIVGLGNPGETHQKNRHNAGFICIDVLANKAQIEWEQNSNHAAIGRGVIGGVQCALIKPMTYMNTSGASVKEWADLYQIPPERVVVIFDDISFAPGVLRIRRRGSAGGHNGVRSIIEHIESQAFPRIKLGVGQRPNEGYDLAEWVVSDMDDDALCALQGAYERACEAVALIVSGEIDSALARYSQ